MAIIHREDSIKEINRKKEEKDQVINQLGEQLAISKIENMQKEAIIDSLGAEQARTKIEILQMKAEIATLKGGE